jgi:hypothetical protein
MDCCSLMETGWRYVFEEWVFYVGGEVGIILLDAYGIVGGRNQKTVHVVSFTCPVTANPNKKILLGSVLAPPAWRGAQTPR